jgi:hypothetical protein
MSSECFSATDASPVSSYCKSSGMWVHIDTLTCQLKVLFCSVCYFKTLCIQWQTDWRMMYWKQFCRSRKRRNGVITVVSVWRNSGKPRPNPNHDSVLSEFRSECPQIQAHNVIASLPGSMKSPNNSLLVKCT